MVRQLLAAKREGLHTDYTREHFEECLRARFTIERTEELSGGTRVLLPGHAPNLSEGDEAGLPGRHRLFQPHRRSGAKQQVRVAVYHGGLPVDRRDADVGPSNRLAQGDAPGQAT